MQIYAIFSFSRYNLYKSIWAPLSLMHQQNLDVYINKIDVGECIGSSNHERGILGVWKKFHLCVIFSILHSNWNHCWLQILPCLYPKEFDVEYHIKYIGSIVNSMYNGSWISGVWKICSFICHSLHSPLKLKSLLRTTCGV